MSDSGRTGGRSAARILVVTLGALVGAALSLFVYAGGESYLTDAPEACVNCHVMNPQYSAWQTSSHRAVAVCNDCHTPADPVGKLATKARSGLAHVWAFSTGRFPDEIRIGPRSREIAERACARCHAPIAESLGHGGVPPEERACTRCHVGVGHP